MHPCGSPPPNETPGEAPSPTSSPRRPVRCVALAGGVGGARLADGLYQALEPHRLTVVVNTGDDFEHLGLHVCPDLDTVMYTLAGMASVQQGWGIEGDTRGAMDMLARYGAPYWFLLADRDLATHVWRTALLRQGADLLAVTRRLAESLGVDADLLPMCNEPAASVIVTPDGRRMPFQDYFVRHHHADPVAAVDFVGIEKARVPAPVREAIEAADVIVWCPSNPFVSLGPILAVPGMRSLLLASRVPRIAVSPIVGGRALKGPAADMLTSMGHEASALGVARLYQGCIDALVIDATDAALAPAIRDLGLEVQVTDAVMRTPADRVRLARFVLDLATPRSPRPGGTTP